MSKNNSAAALAETLRPGDVSKLRMGIFVDRSKGSAFVVILNEENHSWARLTVEDHRFDGDDFDSLCVAINESCADIQRWHDAPDGEIA